MGKSNNIEKWKLCKICLWIIGAILLNTNTLFMQTVHASDESNGEYSYSVKEDGTIKLESYEGEQENVIIPEYIEGMRVSELDGTFMFTNVVTVKIPKTVEVIGPMSTFSFCMQRIEVDSDNPNFCSIDGVLFDKNVKTLCQYPCEYGESIYVIPDGVETIEMYAFEMARELTDVILPDSLKTVKEDAFEVTGINKIEFSENVETIGPKAIIGCKNLKEINVSLQNKFYTEVDGVLFDKNMETLLVYPGANENEEYIVPDGIRRIDKVAFAGCSNLKKIILPETLEDIGIGAFEDCSELKEIEIPYNVKKLPHLLFMRCTSIENIYLPYGLEEIDDWALACDSENLKEILIPETVYSISDYAFSDDTELLVREDSYAYVWSQAHSRKYRCIE